MFYKLFLSDACLGKACYDKCKFKYNHSSADIRIGDAWSTHYKDNEDGVSATIAFTEKGLFLLKSCNIAMEDLPFGIVAEGQMRTLPVRPLYYERVHRDLQDDTISLETTYKYILRKEQIVKIRKYMFNPLLAIRILRKKIK